ncbi:MAG TPA: succinate dehydrogenase, cytochrome b556 subunit [Dehalococcoidia bacterium]|jgi:succinate dehydrogenase / fumarate reductase cytochrome b subunit|nr:succinate dehydrogenase, cytochrome b556 subunit [Dehalococcoidia bacterium]
MPKAGSPRDNYLGVRGWVWAGRYKIERYLYILHRITGLGLVLYLGLHLCVMTVFRMQGEDFYSAVMRLFHNPVFKVGEYLVFAALIFHGLNGLRLIFQELGFLLGKPKPPIYPYRDSLRRRRPLVLAMIGLVVVGAAFVLFDFARGGP